MFLLLNHLLIFINLKEPLLGEMGAVTFGGVTGYSAGYALKKIFKIVIIIAGLIFIILQLLSNLDVLIINWSKIQTMVETAFNNKDLGSMSFLTAHIPEVGGFTAGFIFGFKKG